MGNICDKTYHDGESEDATETEESDDSTPLPIDRSDRRGTRKAIFGESWSAPKSAEQLQRLQALPSKSPEQLQQIEAVLMEPGAWMFSSLDSTAKRHLMNAFREEKMSKGTVIIQEGDRVGPSDPGLFVLESGKLGVFKVEQGQARRVGSVDSRGQIFGELALLHDAPRSATIMAESDATLWSIDREAFNYFVKNAEMLRLRRTEELLQNVEVFGSLPRDGLVNLCEAFESREVKAGKLIVKAGETGDEMFLLETGAAEAHAPGDQRILERYRPGMYFGERALLLNKPRAVNVVATQLSTLLVLKRDKFDRLVPEAHKALMTERLQKYELRGSFVGGTMRTAV